MWANLSSHISRVSAGAAPPFSNGAVITPLHNLTHRLSQPQNRGYRLDGGSRGKSGTESLFSKSRCWTLRAPFCVWPFLHSPQCLLLLHVERHSAGRNGKFYFLYKEFQVTEEIHILKENCQQLSSLLQWGWKKWAGLEMKWCRF